MPARRRSSVSWLALGVGVSLVSAVLGPEVASARPEPADAPPQRLSTDRAPRWRNPTQLHQLAAKGDPAACLELASRLLDGTDASPDYDRILTLLKTAAEGGLGDASFRLGKLYHDGLGVSQDFTRAFGFYTEAARRGVAEAQHNLGAMLVSARGVKRDYIEGLAWLIVAGKSGVETTDEMQVRARIAKRPADVAAAERRAAELWTGLEVNAAGVAPRVTFLKPAPEPVRPATPPPVGVPQLPPAQPMPPPRVEVKMAPVTPDIPPPKP